MSRDFKNYKSNLNQNYNNQNNNQNKENLNNKQNSKQSQNQNSNQNVREEVENVVNKYKDKSENELMGEIDKYVSEAKKNGGINPNDVQNFYNIVAPNMNKEQLDKLNRIIKKLK
jgi:hypothetical protein